MSSWARSRELRCGKGRGRDYREGEGLDGKGVERAEWIGSLFLEQSFGRYLLPIDGVFRLRSEN